MGSERKRHKKDDQNWEGETETKKWGGGLLQDDEMQIRCRHRL